MESRKLGNIYGFDGGNYAGNVYEKYDIAPTLTNMQGGCRQPMIIEEVVRIGGLYDKPDKKHQMGSVFDKECLSPTIDTMQGGYREPMIIDEVKELGFMDNGTGKHQSNTVVDEKGLSPTVTTINGGGTQQIKVLTEQSFVAMRGRNPENPSDRTVGAPTEQRLEPNSQGICNTLTSVTKDNLVMERKCISTRGKENEVASTILSGYERSNMTGFNADNGALEINREENYIKELIESGVLENPGIYSYDGYNNKVNNTGVIGTVVPQNSRWGMTNGHKVIDTTVEYRIRKLTPRECGRLMGVDDKDIDKMLATNSNSQAYKQYGNSIVKQCLIAIFSQMGIQGIPRWNDGLSEKYK